MLNALKTFDSFYTISMSLSFIFEITWYFHWLSSPCHYRYRWYYKIDHIQFLFKQYAISLISHTLNWCVRHSIQFFGMRIGASGLFVEYVTLLHVWWKFSFSSILALHFRRLVMCLCNNTLSFPKSFWYPLICLDTLKWTHRLHWQFCCAILLHLKDPAHARTTHTCI